MFNSKKKTSVFQRYTFIPLNLGVKVISYKHVITIINQNHIVTFTKYVLKTIA